MGSVLNDSCSTWKRRLRLNEGMGLLQPRYPTGWQWGLTGWLQTSCYFSILLPSPLIGGHLLISLFFSFNLPLPSWFVISEVSDKKPLIPKGWRHREEAEKKTHLLGFLPTHPVCICNCRWILGVLPVTLLLDFNWEWTWDAQACRDNASHRLGTGNLGFCSWLCRQFSWNSSWCVCGGGGRGGGI